MSFNYNKSNVIHFVNNYVEREYKNGSETKLPTTHLGIMIANDLK